MIVTFSQVKSDISLPRPEKRWFCSEVEAEAAGWRAAKDRRPSKWVKVGMEPMPRVGMDAPSAPKRPQALAGMPGFEPGNGGIKIRGAANDFKGRFDFSRHALPPSVNTLTAGVEIAPLRFAPRSERHECGAIYFLWGQWERWGQSIYSTSN